MQLTNQEKGRIFRKRNNLSQQQYAEILGVNAPVYAVWERQKDLFNIEQIVRAKCENLQPSANELLTVLINRKGGMKVVGKILNITQFKLRKWSIGCSNIKDPYALFKLLDYVGFPTDRAVELGYFKNTDKTSTDKQG